MTWSAPPPATRWEYHLAAQRRAHALHRAWYRVALAREEYSRPNGATEGQLREVERREEALYKDYAEAAREASTALVAWLDTVDRHKEAP